MEQWDAWMEAMRRREGECPAPVTPAATAVLTVVLLAVAAEIGRAGLSARELEELTAQVRERLAGRLG